MFLFKDGSVPAELIMFHCLNGFYLYSAEGSKCFGEFVSDEKRGNE